MGALWYKEIIHDYKGQILPKPHPYSKMVDRVLERLAAGSGEGEWEGVVIHDDRTMNAFVLPGLVCNGLSDDLVRRRGRRINADVSETEGKCSSSVA